MAFQSRYGNPANYNSSPDTRIDGAASALEVDNKGNLKIGGSVASGTANSGNPVKVGLVYNATPPTASDGQVVDAQGDVNGNTKVTQATSLSRSIDSITNYPAPCEITLVDLATNADVTVTASPAVLLGVFVDTVMSAHAALIKDSTTTKVTVPASSAAGYQIPGYGASFATNITVNSDDAATGMLAIYWRAA